VPETFSVHGDVRPWAGEMLLYSDQNEGQTLKRRSSL
jgi:hypothetical protein